MSWFVAVEPPQKSAYCPMGPGNLFLIWNKYHTVVGMQEKKYRISPVRGFFVGLQSGDALEKRHFLTQRRKDAKSLILLFQYVTLASLPLCVMIF
jgi:hypothetical protein